MSDYRIEKPKFKRRFITFRVSDDQLATIDKIVKRLGVKRSDFLDRALQNELALATSKLFK